jgi:hypothetical protein
MVWGLAAAVAAIAGHAARAHYLRAREHGLHRAQGFSSGGGRWLRQLAGRDSRWTDHRHRRVARRASICLMVSRTSAPYIVVLADADGASPTGSFRRPVAQEGLEHVAKHALNFMHPLPLEESRRSALGRPRSELIHVRFIFKTRLRSGHRPRASTAGTVLWYSVLLVACWWQHRGRFEEYWLAQLTFVLIYGIVGPGVDAARWLHRAVFHWGTRPSSAWAPMRRVC